MDLPLILQTLAVALLSTAIALALGSVVALAFALAPARWAAVLRLAAVATLALPAFFVAAMWMNRIGFAGAWRLDSGPWSDRVLPVACSALVLALLHWPITALLVGPALRQLDPRTLEVWPELQSTRLLRHLFWPAARPRLLPAACLTAILVLGNFAVPALFQARIWTAELWVDYATRLDSWAALLRGAPLVLLVLALVAASIRWHPFAPFNAPSPSLPPHSIPSPHPCLLRRRTGRPLALMIDVAAAVTLALALAFPWLDALLDPRTWTEFLPALRANAPALLRSAAYATGAATIILLAGLLAAPFRLGGFSVVTLALPGLFTGLAWAWIGSQPWGIWARDHGGLVLGALATRYAFIGWLAAVLALRALPPRLLDLARLDGAGRLHRWRHLVWPTQRTTLAAAWLILYLLVLWDVETLLLVVPPGGDTLSLVIFNLLHYGHNAQVTALCLTLAVLAALPLALAASILPRTRTPFLPPPPSALRLFPVVLLATVVASVTGCSPPRSSRGATFDASDSRLFHRVEIIGARGTGPGFFNKPRSLAVDAQDHLFVVDMTGRVQRFDGHGIWQLTWQMPETTRGKPKGMVTAPDGGILLIEPHYHRLNHFSPEGRLLHQWGLRGTGPGELWFPRAVAADPQGTCYLSEYGVVERVQRFQITNGTFLLEFGRPGSDPGAFNRPEGLGLDALGNVYVADSCNHRIQIFAPDGRFLRTHGRPGTGPGELSYPYDVRVDREGRQYVCEFGNHRVQVFDAQDRPLEILGGSGSSPDRLNAPWSLCLDSHENLYVADAGNHRVLKYIRRP